MNLPAPIQSAVHLALTKYTGHEVTIESVSSRGGGCIHNAVRLDTSAGPFFMKWNGDHQFDNFRAETKGLKLLQSAGCFQIPEVISTEVAGKHAFLLMTYIQEGNRDEQFFTVFGEQLAEMHKNTSVKFGLDHHNFIGSLPQKNHPQDSWVDFFIQNRLDYQVKLGLKNGNLTPTDKKQFEALYKLLPNLLPEESASLLHGDLWSGNFMIGANQQPVLIDPAVYYGHREAEIAFTKLFGGFSPAFYDAYNATSPLQPGWEERVDIFNLYPLSVHLNLFGLSYLPQIQSILSRYA